MRKKITIAFHWLVLISLILGVLYGLFLRQYVSWVDWMGELFLRALKMIVIPLIFFTIISGISRNGSAANLGKLGAKTLIFYALTTLLACITGLVLVNLIKPGANSEILLQEISEKSLPAAESRSIRDILISIIPDNIFSAFTTSNTLQIILFAVLLGFFITQLQENQRHSRHFGLVFAGVLNIIATNANDLAGAGRSQQMHSTQRGGSFQSAILAKGIALNRADLVFEHPTVARGFFARLIADQSHSTDSSAK